LYNLIENASLLITPVLSFKHKQFLILKYENFKIEHVYDTFIQNFNKITRTIVRTIKQHRFSNERKRELFKKYISLCLACIAGNDFDRSWRTEPIDRNSN